MRKTSYLDHFTRHQVHQNQEIKYELPDEKKSADHSRVKKRNIAPLVVSRTHVSLSDVIRRNGAKMCDGFRLNAVGRKIDSVGSDFPQCVIQQVTSLYLSQNDLTVLDGIENFCALRTLSVGGNLITDFKQIEWLHPLSQLRNLNLVGNPLCYFPNYRFRIIDRLKHLIVLDSLEVRRAERDHSFHIACIDSSLRDRVLRNHFEINKLQMIQTKIKLHRDLFAFILGHNACSLVSERQTQYMFDCIPNLHEAFSKEKMLTLVRIWRYENSGYYECREQMEVQILRIVIQARRKLSEHPKVRAKELLHGIAKEFRSSEPLQKPRTAENDAESVQSIPVLPFELRSQFQSWYEAFTQMIYLQQDTIIQKQSACEQNLTDTLGYLSSLLATTPDGRQRIISNGASMRPTRHVVNSRESIRNSQSDCVISKHDTERYSSLVSGMKDLPPQQPDPDLTNRRVETSLDSTAPNYTMQNHTKKLHSSDCDSAERKSIRDRGVSPSILSEKNEARQSSRDSTNEHNVKEWDASKTPPENRSPRPRNECHDVPERNKANTRHKHSNLFEKDRIRVKSTPQAPYNPQNGTIRQNSTLASIPASKARGDDNQIVEKYDKALLEREAKYVSALMASEQREIDLKRQLFAAQKELQTHKTALSRDAMECEKIRIEVNLRVQTFAYPKVTKRFFRRWVLFYSVKVSLRRIRHRCGRRRQQEMLIKWRIRCIQSSEIRRFIDRSKRNTLMDYFMAWNTASRVSVVARLTVQQSRQKRLMVEIMRSWKQYTMTEKMSRKMTKSAEYAQAEKQCKMYFSIWKAAALSHRQLVKIQDHQRKREHLQVKRLTLSSWQLYLYQVSRPRCQRLCEMRKQRIFKIEVRFFTAWRHITNTHLHYSRHIQRSVWNRWLKLYTAGRSQKYKKRQEDRMHKKNAFCLWKKGVQAHVSSQRSFLLAHRYSNHRKQRRIWRVWKSYTIAKRKYEQGSTKAWKHYFVKLLRSGWKAWAQQTRLHVRSKKQGKLEELQTHFKIFKRRVVFAKLEDSHLCFLTHFHRRKRTKLLKKWYHKWNLFIAKSKQLLCDYKRVRNHDEDRLIFRFWFRWRQQRLQAMNSDIQISQTQFEQLKAKEMIGNREMEALAIELGRWKAVAEKREKDLRQLQENLETKELETRVLQEEIRSRHNGLAHHDTALQKLYHEKENQEFELQHQVKSLEQGKKHLEAEIDRLRLQLTKERDSETEFYGEMEHMKRDIDSIRRERSRLIHELESNRNESQFQITKLKTQLKKEQAERLDAANQLQEYEAEIAATRNEMRRQHEELEVETQGLNKENCELRHQLETAEAQRHEIEELLREKNAQISQLSSELERLRPSSSTGMIGESSWDRTSNQNSDMSVNESKAETSFPESANLSLDPYCWKVHQDLQLLQDKLSERLAHHSSKSDVSNSRRRLQDISKKNIRRSQRSRLRKIITSE